ncbi:MAG: hypothetical protein LBH01_06450 [Verrucomicrobiales bacterium]|jgi:hypothetical protein|nr:hypothetical protein [Verrucomicrobiales bacterium]
MQPDKRPSEPTLDKVIASPFEHAEESIPRPRKSNKKIFLWIGVVVIVLAIGVVGGIFLTRYLNDPYRTLESFPVAKFLDDYRALAGSRFKADLRVEADLGWKEGVGRLMLFSTSEDSRPVVVMIPAVIAKDIYFTKGQTYVAELEVKEGGLIYANSCRKN